MSLVAPAPWSSSSHCAGHAQSAHTPPVINTHSYIYTAYILHVVSMQVTLQVAVAGADVNADVSANTNEIEIEWGTRAGVLLLAGQIFTD